MRWKSASSESGYICNTAHDHTQPKPHNGAAATAWAAAAVEAGGRRKAREKRPTAPPEGRYTIVPASVRARYWRWCQCLPDAIRWLTQTVKLLGELAKEWCYSQMLTVTGPHCMVSFVLWMADLHLLSSICITLNSWHLHPSSSMVSVSQLMPSLKVFFFLQRSQPVG